MTQRTPVFISVGRRFNDEQHRLVDNVIGLVRTFDLQPRGLPRARWNPEAPVRPIQSEMARCRGVLVVAFPRLRFPGGVEYPDSPGEHALASRDLPTPWLQIEAALALQLGLPLLTLVDDRLHPEGLLNPKHTGYSAHFFSMDACYDALSSDVVEAVGSFAKQVRANANDS